MPDTVKFGICIPQKTLRELEALKQRGGYRNRNRLVLAAIESYLKTEGVKTPSRKETSAA